MHATGTGFGVGHNRTRWVQGRPGAWLRLAAGAVLLLSLQAGAQAMAPQTSLTGELQSLSQRAATVFVGQVVSIARRGGVVEVGFRVEEPVAGSPGASYTLREWAGLWPQGQFRYSLGERALVFLNQASIAGFTSPVDGAEGVVPVVVQGADAPALLDVRRLDAALQRPVGTPLPTAAQGAIPLSAAVAIVTSTQAAMVPEPTRVPLPVRVGVAAGPVPIAVRPGGDVAARISASRSEVAHATR